MRNSKFNTPAISSFSLEGHQCFPSTTPTLALDKLTFVYGPNGSGKSTLIREMRRDSVFEDGSAELRTFDQSFIRDLLNPEHKFEGVLRIVDGPEGVSERLRELNGPGGEIDKAQLQLARLNTTLSNIKESVRVEEESFQSVCWEAKKEVPPIIGEIGLKQGLGRKQKLASKIKEKFLSEEPPTLGNTKNFSAIEVELRELGDAGQPQLPPLPEQPDFVAIDEDIKGLFRKELVPNTDNDLAKLIEAVGNADWVKQGIEHFQQSEPHCPFCQQRVPKQLADKIRTLFSAEYDTAVGQIEKLRHDLTEYRADLQTFVEQLGVYPERIVADLKVEIDEQSKYALAVVEKTNAKLKDMSTSYPLEDIERPAAIPSAYKDAAAQVRRINADRQDLEKAHVRIATEIFDRFAAEKLSSVWTEYRKKSLGSAKAQKSLEEKVTDAQDRLKTLEDEAKELGEKISSTRHVMEEVNSTLEALGFSNFHLAEFGESDSYYKVIRSGGDLAGPTLSEGEKTLVSFLYFFHSVVAAAEDKAESVPLVVAIDDPISSLDSGTLFAISLLCRRLIDLCENYRSRLCQILFLTHNAYFFQEVTFQQLGKTDAQDRLYYTFRKEDGSTTRAISHKKNPIVSTYEQLWSDLKEDRENGRMSVSAQNTMRRILETYFGALGGFQEDLLQKMAPSEQLAARNLLAWINDGSHNIPWEIDYAPTAVDAEQYHQAFRKVFEIEGQLGHYQKMMDQ